MLPSYRNRKGTSARICRLALAKGPLKRGARGIWHFRGRRGFAPGIVAAIVAAGEAERCGDRIVRIEPGKAP